MRDDASAPRALSEFELIELFTERPPDPERIAVGIGDDAAVVRARGAVATSVDAVVEGVHFNREWSTPERIGAKATAAALSDLAAMGAGDAGIEVYLSLGATRGEDPGFLRGIGRGAAAAAGRHGAALAGGDTVASPVLFLAVTVTAHADDPGSLVRRDGARPGDVVAVTGELGSARAGLWLLEDPGLPVSPELPAAVRRDLIARQLDPVPRIEAGVALREAGARAMVDLSDGLIADVGHVARASGAAIRVDAGLVPAGEGVRAVAAAAGLDRDQPVLAGGEDYELAVTLPMGRLEEARAAVAARGVPLTVIGEVLEPGPDRPAGVTVEREGRRVDPGPGGFDHFA